MGATPKYNLPWPELPSQADGPAAFAALASATEAAIDLGGVNSKLVGAQRRVDINGSTVGTSTLWYFADTAGWVVLPAFASTVLIDVCVTVVSPNSTIGLAIVAWDDVYLVNEQWNTSGSGSRTMTYSVGISNAAVGSHPRCYVGLATQAGGNITVPHLSYAYRALA